MHDQCIVHLDLKPENILFESSKSPNLKLIDFGLAAKLDPEVVAKVSIATAEFAAPEIVNRDAVGYYTGQPIGVGKTDAYSLRISLGNSSMPASEHSKGLR